MSVQSITFNKKGYDSFIDFIKAYAIICVLIGHTVPFIDYLGYGLWAGMQVPLFVLVQSFHFYKRDDTKIDIVKILKRVLFPFLFFSIITFLILLVIDEESCKLLIMRCLRNGGVRTW